MPVRQGEPTSCPTDGNRGALPKSHPPGFSLAWEKVSRLRADGIEDLLITDYEEIEGVGVMPYDPDWERVAFLERSGSFHALCARSLNTNIVGYAAFHVTPNIHSRHFLDAVNDLIWALPEWRGKVGLSLIGEAERYLKARGVKRIVYASKPHYARFARVLGLRGYEPYESLHAKVL